MKVQIKEVTKKEEIKYPCLMKYNDTDGFIVLFCSNTKGMVVAGGRDWNVGDYDEHWIASAFTPFKGEIILSND